MKAVAGAVGRFGVLVWLAAWLSACGGGGGSDGPANQRPQAIFVVYSQTAGVPSTVTFNAGESRDPDGSIARYDWDFGDGGSGTGGVATHVYNAAGRYTVALTVTDNQGQTASTSQLVEVLDAQAPVPVINVSAPHYIAPATVRFDGSGSTDADGEITTYYWDFGDAGAFDQQAQAEHVYQQAGTYQVVLRLVDDTGLEASQSTTVTILPRSAGQHSISGVVRAAQQLYVDADTNDPLSAHAPNNSTVEAQLIGNPSATAGFVTATATGNTDNGDYFASSSDASDYYQVSLQAGQKILLEIADWEAGGAADLDLHLYNSLGVEVDFSVGTSDVEAVEAPVADDYFVEVLAFSGQSNYQLSTGISAARIPARAWSMGSRAPVLEDQVLLQLKGDGVLKPQVRQQRLQALQLQGRAAAGRLARMSLSQRPALRTLAAGFSRTPEQAGKQATLRAIKALARDPSVAKVSANYRVDARVTLPTDPYYAEQWHYPQINLPQAWDYANGTGVVVAVLDTGVFLAHEDLAANLTAGYDFISDPANSLDGDGLDGNPDDPGDGGLNGESSWHGSHVAGTLTAVANNGLGGAGVAWGARLMPLRVLGAEGGSSYDIIQALRYAAGLPNDSGQVPAVTAKVANLSLGCQFCYSGAEEQAYQQLHDAGLILVAAAGNENSTDPSFPASYAGVVSVAATDRLDARAPYSNQSMSVDIAAPGGNQRLGASGGVLSSVVNTDSGTRRSAYAWYQGTSMASPHVAGVVALMAQIYPALTPADFDQAIASGSITVDLGSPGRDDSFGYGRIDAHQAVLYALALAGNGVPASLSVNPGLVDFGTLQNAASVQLSKSGNGALQLQSVSDDASWLTVSADSVDADGFGSYQLSVDRSGLADGSYRAQVTFTDSDNKTAQVAVSLTQGAQSSDQGAGYLYILLLDESFNVFDQTSMNPDGAGDYAYSFSQLPEGRFYLVAGTDNDNDLFLCDAGEICGAYPTLGLLTPVLINGDISNADFLVLLGDAVNSAASGSGAERRSFRRPR